jgi:RNA polymerase sigma factor (sigma-70 family)
LDAGSKKQVSATIYPTTRHPYQHKHISGTMKPHTPSSPHPDQRYIDGLRRQDSVILEEIYQKYSGIIRQWVLQNSGSVEEAKDLFQEGLIQLYLIASDPHFQLTCSFGYFFQLVCQRKWFKELKKNKKDQEVRLSEQSRINIQESDPQLEKEKLEDEIRREEILDQTFHQLSDLCQQLLLKIKTGASASEIAEQLDMNNANTVYQRRHACIKRWKQLFDEANNGK